MNKENRFITEPWFLGSFAENADVELKFLLDIFNNYTAWRRSFYSKEVGLGDLADDRNKKSFRSFIERLEKELKNLMNILQQSVPFALPHYMSHMTADQLLPAVLGYIAGMFYNSNNISFESSPATTLLEIEVGKQLADLVGFDKDKAWGHITSCGTIANMEALLVARNLKYFPLSIHRVAKCLNLGRVEVMLPDKSVHAISKLSEKELLNIESFQCFKLIYSLISTYIEKSGKTAEYAKEKIITMLREEGLSMYGLFTLSPGVILVPRNCHYSIPKIVEVLGIGKRYIVPIELDRYYRLDAKYLEEAVNSYFAQDIPIIAVVGVVGSTATGSIDPVHKVIEIRDKLLRRGGSFYVHIDAAYGGYLRSILRDKNNALISWEEIKKLNTPIDNKISRFAAKDACMHLPVLCNSIMQTSAAHSHANGKTLNLLSKDIYKSLAALGNTDSVTLDPHKLGYIPYPAGGIIFRNKDVKNMLVSGAPYIFNEVMGKSMEFLGPYIFEGSKPGAAAAACWLAHKVIPLNREGYGIILNKTLENAKIIYAKLDKIKINIKRRKNFVIYMMFKPDSNIICFVVNRIKNQSLDAMNTLNEKIYERLCLSEGKQSNGNIGFYVSKMEFSFKDYGSSVKPVIKKIGIKQEEHLESLSSVIALRLTLMNPLSFIEDDFKDGIMADEFINQLKRVIREV